jgi:putative acetyltransferase
MNIQIRKVQQDDNAKLASIIRQVLEEFKANKQGTVYYDKTTDNLFELFQKQGSIYFTAIINDEIVGGCGIYPTENLPQGYCELVKFYLLPEARNYGIGKMLMEKCFDFAKVNSYKKVYLESMPELNKAVTLYKKYGFNPIEERLGDPSHFGCSVLMVKELQ